VQSCHQEQQTISDAELSVLPFRFLLAPCRNLCRIQRWNDHHHIYHLFTGTFKEGYWTGFLVRCRLVTSVSHTEKMTLSNSNSQLRETPSEVTSSTL
jgi:hypothetical protein